MAANAGGRGAGDCAGTADWADRQPVARLGRVGLQRHARQPLGAGVPTVCGRVVFSQRAGRMAGKRDAPAGSVAHNHATQITSLENLRPSQSNKVSAVTISLPKGTDLNDILTVGSYAITGANASGILNMPITAAGRMYVFQGDTIVLQVWTMNTHTSAVYGKVLFYRKYVPELGWSEWWEIAVATPPQEYDLSLAGGWIKSRCCKYFKTQESLCIVNCSINGPVVIGSSCVATLSEGFRPKETCAFPGQVYKSGERRTADVLVLSNGEIHVYADVDGSYVSFLCAFIASG